MTGRAHRWPSSATVSVIAALACGAPDRAPPGGELPQVASEAPSPVADLHTHIRTERAAELMGEFDDAGESTPSSAEDLIAALDRAAVERALVLSVAYLFGAPDVDPANEHELVRAENDYVVAEAARAPDRLTPACSVSPLAPYALDEVERCLTVLGVGTLKLHFTNSDVDLRSAEHLTRLREVFSLLEGQGASAVVHMRTRADDYGAADVRHFIDDVLALAPGVPIVVAHMGGWGGYDDATDAALGEFVVAIRDGRLGADRIWFGLGAVVFLPEAAGADTALAETVRAANHQLVDRIRALGVERVVYGTDWPGWPPVAEPSERIRANVELIRTALELEEEEVAQLFENQALLGLDRARE